MGFLNDQTTKYYALEYVLAEVVDNNPDVNKLLELLIPLMAADESNGLQEPVPPFSAYIVFYSGNLEVLRKVVSFYCNDELTITTLKLKVKRHAEIEPVPFEISQIKFLQVLQDEDVCSTR